MAETNATTNAVGLFFVAWACIWSLVMAVAMVYLYTKRHMAFLRMRSLPLSFGGVFLLHVYWFLCQLGVSWGSEFPPTLEYWIMGLWLPFGIALFQASNSQFVHVAIAQKRFASKTSAKFAPKSKFDRVFGRLRRMDYSQKMFTGITIGMAVQLFLTTTIYLVSKRFHPQFGANGTEGNPYFKGWEWWPTIFWQLFWAWIVAPYILWKSRGINDTHGWRLQTMVCCLAGLHAAPMWLIALYIPAFSGMNKYWVPPQWIALSVMVIEIFTILLPCWEVRRHQALQAETLRTIAIWESKNKTSSLASGFSSVSIKIADRAEQWKHVTDVEKHDHNVTSVSMSESNLTMAALESVMNRNPEPLRQFSALRDFSGENISFLVDVRDFKKSIPAFAHNAKDVEGTDEAAREIIRERFNRALAIYTEYISERDAEFPINIAANVRVRLEAIFEGPARVLYGNCPLVDNITPFHLLPSDQVSQRGLASGSPPLSPGFPPARSCDSQAIRCKAMYWGEVPETFDSHAFDEAERAIKYLVLTNTWPRFIKEHRSSLDSNDSRETYRSTESRSTTKRISKYFKNMGS